MEVSTKIFGKAKGGKIVYRSAVIYRPYPHSKGDVVVSEGIVFLITSVGKTVTAKNLFNGKKQRLPSQGELLVKHSAVVSKIYPNLEVISPEDYQSIPVQNPKKDVGKKVQVVVYEGRAYLVE